MRREQRHPEGFVLEIGRAYVWRSTVRSNNSIALPMAGMLTVLDLGRASIDHDHVRDPRPAMRNKAPRPAEMPASTQMDVQLLGQWVLAIQRRVDRLERHVHLRSISEPIGEVQADLLGAPLRTQLGLHDVSQLGPVELELLGPASAFLGSSLRCVRPVAASPTVASQLSADRRRAPFELARDRADRLPGHLQVSDPDPLINRQIGTRQLGSLHRCLSSCVEDPTMTGSATHAEILTRRSDRHASRQQRPEPISISDLLLLRPRTNHQTEPPRTRQCCDDHWNSANLNRTVSPTRRYVALVGLNRIPSQDSGMAPTIAGAGGPQLRSGEHHCAARIVASPDSAATESGVPVAGGAGAKSLTDIVSQRDRFEPVGGAWRENNLPHCDDEPEHIGEQGGGSC